MDLKLYAEFIGIVADKIGPSATVLFCYFLYVSREKRLETQKRENGTWVDIKSVAEGLKIDIAKVQEETNGLAKFCEKLTALEETQTRAIELSARDIGVVSKTADRIEQNMARA